MTQMIYGRKNTDDVRRKPLTKVHWPSDRLWYTGIYSGRHLSPFYILHIAVTWFLLNPLKLKRLDHYIQVHNHVILECKLDIGTMPFFFVSNHFEPFYLIFQKHVRKNIYDIRRK